MASKEKITLIGIVISILIAIGFFNAPNIVMVRQTLYSVCPQYVSNSFGVIFLNNGNANTNLCVNVSSEDIKFKRNNDCLSIAPNPDKQTQFIFNLETSSLPRKKTNISISYDYYYSKYLFFPIKAKIICNYHTEGYVSSNLELIE